MGNINETEDEAGERKKTDNILRLNETSNVFLFHG